MHRNLTLAACGEQFLRSCTRVRTTRLQDVSVAKDCAKNVGHLGHSRSTVEPDPTQEGKGETMYATTNGRRPAAGAVATRSRFLQMSCLAVLGGTGLLAGASASAADCEVVASGLRAPIGSVLTNQGNLLISETGIANVPASGRISIVSPDGTRRTLLDGLPQGTNAAGRDASGPNGITMRGRTIYVAIGQGDTVIPGPNGTTVPNPDVSSQLFSSVLAIHLSAAAEKATSGFSLSEQDQLTLAGGGRVTLSNGGGDKLSIELVVNFEDYVAEGVPGNVRNSNPFDMVVVGDNMFVTNGGLNKLYKVDLRSGAYTDLAIFGPIPNPNPPPPATNGPPSVEAVPTGLAYSDGAVLVSLLSGGPFLPGVSRIKAVDPVTGAQADFITGLRTSIDILPVRAGGDTDYLALENNFAPVPAFPPSGASIKRFEAPGGTGVAVDGCTMHRPTSMTFDSRSNTMYATELLLGTVVKVPLD